MQAVMFSALVVVGAGAAPTNDDLNDALFVVDGYSDSQDNTEATLEIGEPNP